ncbi:hypothetical protein U1Q18_049961 [Sarracenia purpurea var. burkii]
MHGFQFKSNVEKNFLNQEINIESTSDDDAGQKDEAVDVFHGNDHEQSEYESKISQLNYNLEEIFRDHILLPDSNSLQGAAPQKEISIEASKDNESSMCLVEILQSNDDVEEMARDDDLEPNSNHVEDVIAGTLENVSFKNDKPSERESEIPQPSGEVGELIRDDALEPNSSRVEVPGAVSTKNIAITTFESGESPEREIQILQPNVIIQDDILESYSERFDDAMLHDNMMIKVPKHKLSNRDVEIPPLKDAHGVFRDTVLKSVSECFENVSSQKHPIIDASKGNAQLDHTATNSQWNDSSSRESCEEIPESPGSDIELEISSPESIIEPVVLPQEAKIADPIDEKRIKYEMEVAQLNDNLREIFKSNDTYESSETLDYKSEPKTTYQVIDLTLSDDKECESRIIVIDDDD